MDKLAEFLVLLIGCILGCLITSIIHDVRDSKRLIGNFKIKSTEDECLYSLYVEKPLNDIPKMQYILMKVENEGSQDLQGL